MSEPRDPTTPEDPDTPDVGDSSGSSDAQPGRTPRASTAAPQTAPIYRSALRYTLILTVVLAVGGGLIGALTVGTPGLWGALLGAGISLVFSGATPLSMLFTADKPIEKTIGVVMGAWLVKVIVVIAVLVVLRGMEFYDRPVFGIVLLIGVGASAFLDYRAVAGARTPYTQPQATQD